MNEKSNRSIVKAQLAKAQALLNLKNPKTDEAMKLLNPLVKKKNASWQVFHYAGIAFVQKGEYGTALSFLSEAMKQGSDESETFHAMSICYFNMAEYEQAESYENKALQRNPEFFKGWLHLGSLYRAQAKLDQALKCYHKANKIDPSSADVAYRIGEIYSDQGDLNKALELFNITLKIDKEYLNAYVMKADVLIKQKKYDEAEDTLYKVLSYEPQNATAQVSLGELYKVQGNYKKAMNLYARLIAQHPQQPGIRVNYGQCLQELGRYDEAETHYMKAFEDAPTTFEPLSNYLMCMHYNPSRTKEEIFEAHKLWDQYFAPEARPERPVPLDKNENKRLRVGFISGGFRAHPVGWMITEALENLPKDQFEVYCYTTNNTYDKITKRIYAATDKWQSVIGYNDAIIANMINEDEIDILVELSGHSADTRLKTIDLEPAPITVKWVGGLFNTTGLRSMDYLLTDHFETPEGEERFYTEKLVRMPDDYISFLPPDYCPDVEALPAKENGYITFGCFNNPTKVNDLTLTKWAEVMNLVPESRLFLKSKQYDTKELRNRIIETLESCGISGERLIFEGSSPHDKLLATYNKVDVALDPWPYSGGLTTCEALWMGVPVVTKPGPTFAGRHSATHLSNAGFHEWVTDSWSDYVEKAVELASDLKVLQEIRSGLRDKVASSPVTDGPRFGAHLSRAFREMWKQRVRGYKENLPEGEWQGHINVVPLSENEIDRSTERKDAMDQVDEIEDDFIKEGVLEAVAEAYPQSNGHGSGSINGKAIQENKSADKLNEPKIYKFETKGGVVICTPPNTEIMTPYVLLEQNEWYENEVNFIRDYLKSGMNIVDVGAGFGVYSLPAANLIGVEGKVFSFEPGTAAKKYLEMSKLENGFENMEIIGKAVSKNAGKKHWKVAETPELNKLDENGEQEVQTITMDSWWQFEGEPAIAFLKVDVNGAEAEVLNGATELLRSESPVLLISITDQKSNDFVAELKAHEYSLYEYIPGPGILAEHEIEAGADPYMQNLIAIPQCRIEEFKNDGWLHDELVKPKEVDQDLWKTELSKFSWTQDLMGHWKSHSKSEGIMSYLKALNYLIAAEQIDIQKDEIDQPRSQKAIMLLSAAQILIQLYNQGSNSTSVVFTLVRTLNALGKRSQAVEVMQKLVESTKLGQENINVELPFMLPISEQDKTSVKTDLDKWLMVRTVEAWILLKDLTTYLSGPQERKLLEVLEGNPEVIKRFKDSKKSQIKASESFGIGNGMMNGVQKEKNRQPKVIHICFNHVYAQSLSDLIEYVNENSDQEHRVFIETRQAIPNYSVSIVSNPASELFSFKTNLESITRECLKDEVDMIMFHGIFYDWQKEMIKTIGDKKHIGWVIWGGDLYNPIKNNAPMFEVVSHIQSIHTLGSSDVTVFEDTYGSKPHHLFGYPYPGLYKQSSMSSKKQNPPVIVVGNSGDPSNEHLEILNMLAKKEDIHNYRLLLPVSYSFNATYRETLLKAIKQLGLEEISELKEDFIHPKKYAQLLQCAYMQITAHNRQQAVGNLLISFNSGNHAVLREKIKVDGKEIINPTWDFLTGRGFKPVKLTDFSKTASIREFGEIPEKINREHQNIIKNKFTLELRARELQESVQKMFIDARGRYGSV